MPDGGCDDLMTSQGKEMLLKSYFFYKIVILKYFFFAYQNVFEVGYSDLGQVACVTVDEFATSDEVHSETLLKRNVYANVRN